MPIKTDSSLYSSIKQAGEYEHETNDCCVRALSLAANIPYSLAHKIAAKYGRKDRGGMYYRQYDQMLNDHGFKRAKTPYYGLKLTVTQFCKLYPSGSFFVTKRGHAFHIRDGVVHDWTWSTGARTRVLEAYQFLG
jgi:hypothetical protein